MFQQKPPVMRDTVADLRGADRKLNQEVTVSGVVRTGAQIGRDYCAAGLYLTEAAGAILLRIKNDKGERPIFDEKEYLDKRVEVLGRYPAQENFCEALICECEDYILVDTIVLSQGPTPTSPPPLQTSLVPNFEEKAPVPSHAEPFVLDSGLHKNQSTADRVMFEEEIRALSDAPWIRVHFSEYNLGEKSFITLISLKDGGKQRLDGAALEEWQYASAFFNGNAVRVTLTVAFGESGIFFKITEITVGEYMRDQTLPPNGSEE